MASDVEGSHDLPRFLHAPEAAWPTAIHYAIRDLDEARAYLAHPVLDAYFDGEPDPTTLGLLRRR